MFGMLKNVILSKKLKVEELQERIDLFYAQGKIGAEEKAQLEDMVFENKTVDAERESLEAMYRVLVEKYNALEKRVAMLEGGEAGEGEGGDGASYPDWKMWDGVSTDYQPGAIVRHNGKLWLNVLEGMQNVWEPGVADERYWAEHSA